MAFSKSEFVDWHRNAMTRELMKFVKELIDQGKDTLAQEAGTNPLADKHLVGGIAAFQEILEWQPEFTENDD